MSAYWILFLIPFFGLVMPGRLSTGTWRLAWFAMATMAALAIGLRHQVGGDWDTYLQIYESASTENLPGVLELIRDPGYAVLNWLSARLGFGIYGVNLACGMLFVTGFGLFASRQPMPWMAWVICIPYVLIVVAMGYTRQGAALGLILWALARLQEGRLWRFALLVALAGLFHMTAVLLMPLAFLVTRKGGWGHMIALMVAFLAAAVALLHSYYETLLQNYIESEMASEGAAIRVWMNAVPAALMLLMTRKWQRRWPDPGHWRYIAWVSIAAVFIVGLSSTAVDRAALYMTPVQVYVWSRFPLLFKDSAQRAAVAIGICLMYAAVLGVWLTMAIHAGYWLPYRNIIFE
jgi:uncharacterized membrane protein